MTCAVSRWLLIWLVCSVVAACSTTGPKQTPQLIASYTPADFAAPIASAQGQAEQLADARAKIARGMASDASFSEVASGLWAVQFTGIERAAGEAMLSKALPQLALMTASEQRSILSAAHTIAPKAAAPILSELLGVIATPREFAIASYVMLRAAGADTVQRARARELIRAAMRLRFADEPATTDQLDTGEPRLLALRGVLDERAAPLTRPPLVDLLRAPLSPQLPVIYSFQRTGRQHFGLVMVRGVDGKFVRNPDGSYFALAQLALALTELPGTVTNGNTPQGLFTIIGAGIARNKWIGPTPYIESRVPIEAPVAQFEHSTPSDATATWTHERYAAMLPPSWRTHWPFQEAYLAGRAGRNEMILHGTTINSNNYQGRSFFPGTPSAGCLVAMESWEPSTGQLIKSDQLSLLKAFTKDGVDRGHLIVVELDAKLAPVVLDDVIADIEALSN